jgi:hypothetical protein
MSTVLSIDDDDDDTFLVKFYVSFFTSVLIHRTRAISFTETVSVTEYYCTSCPTFCSKAKDGHLETNLHASLSNYGSCSPLLYKVKYKIL